MPKAKRTHKKTAKGKHSGLGKYVVSVKRNYKAVERVKDYILRNNEFEFEEKLILVRLVNTVLYRNRRTGFDKEAHKRWEELGLGLFYRIGEGRE